MPMDLSYITQITRTTKFVVVGTYNAMVYITKDLHLSFSLFRLFLLFYCTTHHRSSNFVPRRRSIRTFKVQAVTLCYGMRHQRSTSFILSISAVSVVLLHHSSQK